MPKQKATTAYIIKQALRVFRTKGYADTSMQDIANACGLQKGSLYHHFKGKKGLLKAVIHHVHEYYKQEVFIHAYKPNLSATQKIKLLADISATQFFASDSGCLMGNLALETASTHPDFAELVQAFFADWIGAMRHIFQEVHTPEMAQQLAKDSVALIEGAVMMMRLFNDKSFLEQAHQKIICFITQKVI